MKKPAEIIRREIAFRGAISFARFMELALYCPNCGFYEQESDIIGRRGHFFTSVSVGSLFGQLLAFQFADWLQEQERSTERPDKGKPLHIVEAGAHDGALARDLLGWLQLHRRTLFERLQYWIIEPSPRRRRWQRANLGEFGAQVKWLPRFDHSTVQRFTGVIFSNELLDSMPVHRIGWDAKRRQWFEWGVAASGDSFVWTRLPGPVAGVIVQRFNHLTKLLDILPDGFTTEVCPAAEQWWLQAASALKQGRLLTIDYGLCTEEFFAPQRAGGTLRAYNRHRQSDDILANPGEQDITAHVNFSALQAAGEAAGLKTDGLFTQAQFLTGIAERVWSKPGLRNKWTAAHTRQFQTLIHPDHLGRAFRVLIQSR